MPDQSTTAQFERLHRRAVWLNTVTMVLGLLLLTGFAMRPAPGPRGSSR